MCYHAAVQARLDLRKLTNMRPVTGCEIIWNQTNKGCYAHHSSEITQGNGVARHLCWVADLHVLSQQMDTLQDVTPNPPIVPSQDASEQSQPDIAVTKSVQVGSAEGNLDDCRALAPNFEDVQQIFPVRRQGFCVNSNGLDVNESATNLAPDWDIWTEEDIRCCLRICYQGAIRSKLDPASTSHSNVTGCEIIWNQPNKGCYVHQSLEITQGNGEPRHLCWIADLDALSEHVNRLNATMNAKASSHEDHANSLAGVAQARTAQKVTGTMEIVVQSQQEPEQFASDLRATEGVRTTIADVADTTVEHVQVSLHPALPQPLVAPAAALADSQASASKSVLIQASGESIAAPAAGASRDRELLAQFVVTLPAEPLDAAAELVSKLNSLDTTLAELRLQNHMFDQGLDTVVHMKKVQATWQNLQN